MYVSKKDGTRQYKQEMLKARDTNSSHTHLSRCLCHLLGRRVVVSVFLALTVV